MSQGIKHIDKALTNMSIRYGNEKINYIADVAFPKIPVTKSTDKFFIYTNDFRLPETLRAYGAESNQITWGVSTASYALEWHSLTDIVADREIPNYDSPLMAKADTTEELTDKIMLRKEVEAAKVAFTTTSWSNNRTITATANAWHTSTAFPVQAVLSGNSVILKNSGGSPNVGIMGNVTYTNTRENSNVHERYKYVQASIVTPDMLAALFDLKKLYVGNAVVDTTIEGVSTSPGFVWDDAMLIANMAQGTVSRKTKTAMAKLQKSDRVVKTYRKEENEGEAIEVNEEYQFRAVATLSAYYINNPALG